MIGSDENGCLFREKSGNKWVGGRPRGAGGGTNVFFQILLRPSRPMKPWFCQNSLKFSTLSFQGPIPFSTTQIESFHSKTQLKNGRHFCVPQSQLQPSFPSHKTISDFYHKSQPFMCVCVRLFLTLRIHIPTPFSRIQTTTPPSVLHTRPDGQIKDSEPARVHDPLSLEWTTSHYVLFYFYLSSLLATIARPPSLDLTGRHCLAKAPYL